ncbi:MAG: N-acetylmuramoyl-L-alanine amidase [Bryobacteraceae bacterium]|jgi:hypothetical protein
MVAVIAYDHPVKNLIAGLDATGHVTHTAYRKTSVTFHHNGGRLSHEGVLQVWQTREASAHFDVDGAGSVAQYVRVNEYAWATGNTAGNQSSISIELADATLAPDWLVAEVTWHSGARLAGWLFARVIGAAPTRDNVFVHHHWKDTLCAGPHMDRVFDQLLAAVQAAYHEFVPQSRAQTAPATGGARKSIDQLVDEVLAGQWGNGTERSRRLLAAGYSPTEVQNAVNSRHGGQTTKVAVRPSVQVIAEQVIKGQWGNALERRRRLSAAGYDYDAVQAEVNRQLR